MLMIRRWRRTKQLWLAKDRRCEGSCTQSAEMRFSYNGAFLRRLPPTFDSVRVHLQQCRAIQQHSIEIAISLVILYSSDGKIFN